MKKKTLLVLLALIAVALSPLAHAVDFNDLEEWKPDKFYHRGDVVRLGYEMYISVLPSKGRSPQTNSIKWRLIDYNKRRTFRIKTLYPIGSVVSHGGKHYIARALNVPLSSARLNDQRRWLEFTHPGLNYDLPTVPGDPDEVDSLIGADTNNNGIRDDYEIAIAFSNLPAPVKDAALSAGKAYGDLMEVASEHFEVTRENAASIMHNLVLARACKSQLRALYHGVAWEDTTYFDTLDRIEAKYKLQNMLMAVLSEDGFFRPTPEIAEPCNALATI